MADVTINGGTALSLDQRTGLWGPYWTSPSVGYVIFQVSDNSIVVLKTTDSGANWTEQDTANNPTDNTTRTMAVYFDQETKGDSGTILHIAWVFSSANTVRYVQFDTSDDTFGTIRTVDALTVSATAVDSDVSVVKSVSGRVYVCASGDMDAHTENTDHSMRSSSDGFATNNESELSPYSTDEELVTLMPGAAADEDDICAVVVDTINADLEFWKFDASANTWGVTAIDTGLSQNQAIMRGAKRFAVAVSRHSDEHILVVYWNDRDTATADFKSVDITQATPTITGKTDLHSSLDSYFISMLINQQNNDVYVAYCGSDAGDEAIFSLVQVYFKKSDDGMASWGTEQTYSDADDDLRMTHMGRTVGSAGGRVMPSFYNDDLDTVLINDGNDVEIAAEAAGIPIDEQMAARAWGIPMTPPIRQQVVAYGEL